MGCLGFPVSRCDKQPVLVEQKSKCPAIKEIEHVAHAETVSKASLNQEVPCNSREALSVGGCLGLPFGGA